MHNPYYYDHGGTRWGLWILMIVAMLVFFAIVAWAVVTILRQREGRQIGGVPSPPASGSNTPDPLRILHERLARGEIEIDEYTRRRDLIRGDGPAAPSG